MNTTQATELFTTMASTAITREEDARRDLAAQLTTAAAGSLTYGMRNVLTAQGHALPWRRALEIAETHGGIIEGVRAATEIAMQHLIEFGISNSSDHITNVETIATHDGHRMFLRNVRGLLAAIK